MTSKLRIRITPSLLMADFALTQAFYQSLGFAMTGCSKERDWAEFERDGAVLQFYTEPPVGTPARPICSGTFYFFPGSIDKLAAEWAAKVPFEWGPEEMPYGMREFAIKDPNGYLLAFAEPIFATSNASA